MDDARKGLWRDLNRYQSTVNRVVYAAGIAVRGTANEMEPDGLRTMFEVNTLAALEAHRDGQVAWPQEAF